MDLEYKKEIEQELKKFFSNKKRKTRKISNELFDSILRLEEYTLRGGKRIRPVLIIVSYLGFGGKNLKEIIKFASSIEMLQSFFLIHDDFMDGHDLRRNGPTIHAGYKTKYGKKTSDNLAIDVGDICISYAVQPILDCKFDNNKKINALKEFFSIIEKTCYGQLLDLIPGTKDVNEEFVRKIYEYKTAEYTIAGPLKLGAILAEANSQEIKKLEKIGIKLGLAFQIKDDILGVFGNEKELGKPIGSDLIEGKKTLLIVKANNRFINKKIGKKLRPEEIKRIRELIIKSGSLKYSEDLVKKLISNIKKDINLLGIKAKQKEFLLNLSDYIGKREK